MGANSKLNGMRPLLVGALVIAAIAPAGCARTAGPSAQSLEPIPTAILVPQSSGVPQGGDDGNVSAYPTRRPYALATARPTTPGNQPPAVTAHAPAGTVKVDPSFDEQAVDEDRDGLIDQLVLTTTISVPIPGQYMANVRLLDPSGVQVESTGTGEISLVAGSQALTLTLDGKYIYQSGRWGPYTPVVMIVYFGKDTQTVLDGAYLNQTQSYDYMQFRHDRVSVDPGSLSTQAVDTNGDGLFDELFVTGIVTVDEAGVYAINSGLYGSNPYGQIAAEYMVFRLAAGPNQFTVVYKGSDIAASGQDGPYTVFDFAIYLKADPMNYTISGGSLHPGYKTAAYKASQFGG